MSDVQPDRSSFKTKDVGYALESTDPWFRPVDIQVGPDGALYVADLYEQRIDHASHYQGRIHKESGRIYRLRAKGADYVAAEVRSAQGIDGRPCNATGERQQVAPAGGAARAADSARQVHRRGAACGTRA